MVLWAPVLNLSKLDELDAKAQGDSPKVMSTSASDNSISSNRSSASSTLLALIDDISGYWRRLEEESYDVINKKKIKVLAHVFSKTHDGVQLSSASSSATVKEAGNLSRRKTKRETLKDVKESLKEVKSATPVMDTTPQVTPFIAPHSAAFQTSFPARSISHPQLSAYTSPYPGQMGGSPRPEDQLSEVNQRLAILMAELDELRKNESKTPKHTQMASPQVQPVAAQAAAPVVQTPSLNDFLAPLNNTSVGLLAILCFSLVLFSLNASKMGVAIGVAQTGLMAVIVYMVAKGTTISTTTRA